MERIRVVQVVAAVALVAAGTGVAAAAAGDGGDPPGHTGTVVNPQGHEVDEHAAHGQSTAAQARAGHGGHGRPEHARSDHAAGRGHGHAFGHLSPAARREAIAAMQAEHRAARPGHDHSGQGRGPGRDQGDTP